MSSSAEVSSIHAELAKIQATLSELITGHQRLGDSLREHIAALSAKVVANGAAAEAKVPKAKKAVNMAAPTVAVPLDGSAESAAAADGSAEEKKDDKPKAKAKPKMTKPAYIIANWQTEALNKAIQTALGEAAYAAAIATGTDAEKGKAIATALKPSGQKTLLAGVPEFNA